MEGRITTCKSTENFAHIIKYNVQNAAKSFKTHKKPPKSPSPIARIKKITYLCTRNPPHRKPEWRNR